MDFVNSCSKKQELQKIKKSLRFRDRVSASLQAKR